MKNDSKGLLKKKINELTLEDFANIEKPLGTASLPFPMWGPQRVEHEKRTDIVPDLSFIASDQSPLKIYSERPYDEVVAMAFCDMPVPSMLPLFKDGLERRGDPLQRQKDMLEGKQPQNENYNRTQMLIGDPGHGKSFMGAMLGRLRGTGKIEIFDCGGKNMNDLLFEMVLDFGTGDALPKAIDKRLKAGTLEPLSLAILKGLAGASVDENGGLVGIDWSVTKNAGNDVVEETFEALKKVSKIEGLDNAGGNALGMNSQYGPLIRAYLENREIVLDEYNKSREGSDNALQTVIQFMIGEIRETTVDNPLKNKDNTSGPSTFTFKREDMGAGFFVTFTGNKTEDGITTRSLNRSVYDRLKPDTLPDPSVIDWQHRICQMMVGIPVSTLYSVFQDSADKDPDAFGEWLMALRKKKAEIDGAPVPELQQTLLANWKNVVNSSEKLAKFYDKWAAMTDASKITSNGNADLVEEVDDEYSKKEGMSFRRIKQHLEEAIPIRSRMEPSDAVASIDFKSWGKTPKLAERVEENPSLNFGSRLVEYIERMVFEKSGSVGKRKLYEKLTKQMAADGLREMHLQEAARSSQKSVEQDLNISAFSDRDMNKQANLARKVFCDYIRQVDPQITAPDDQIITQKRFLEALQGVSKLDTAATKEIFVANRDHEELFAGRPLVQAVIKDAAVYAVEDRDLDFKIEDVVHHDDLMASLAFPTVSAKNLGAVWETNLRPLTVNETQPSPGAAAGKPGLQGRDEALHIAENSSNHGIATTSLQVKLGEGDEAHSTSIHIVRNTNRGKTLIVGEKVPSKLLAAFKEAGIVHVDRADPNARTKVETALADLTRGLPGSIKERLNEAFKYRNGVDGEFLKSKRTGVFDASDEEAEKAYLEEAEKKYLEGKQVSDLLVDTKVGMTYPKYVVRKKAA